MHALLEALALRPSSEDSGSDSVYTTMDHISDVFKNVDSVEVEDGTGDVLFTDASAPGVTFRYGVVAGEKIEVSVDPGGGGGSV